MDTVESLAEELFLLQTLGDDPVTRSITVAVFCLAADLDMPVIAEGVEDTSILPVLHDLGCPLGG